MSDSDDLKHYGILRKSGRYPWGSGKNPYQRGISFYQGVKELQKAGMTEAEIAKAFSVPGKPFTVAMLRANKSIANSEIFKYQQLQIQRMKEKQMSNTAIAERLGMPESTVRSRLKKIDEEYSDITMKTADVVKKRIDGGAYIDVGKGVEKHLGVSPERLSTAVAMLEDEGYEVITIWQEQLGMAGQNTTYKVIAPPGTTRDDVYKNLDKISTFGVFSEDGGRTFQEIKKPIPVNPKRVDVKYAEDGGDKMDGVIELRRGVEDISLGSANYAQVRIAVGDGHYLKGMAVYSDDLPKGVDIRFNTNKSRGENPLDAMKVLEDDPEAPFKTTVRQIYYDDGTGKKKQSPVNIVGTEDPDGLKFPGEEGAWIKWSTKLSSQMLSKQTPGLAQEQLKIARDNKEAELKEYQSLNNPTIKKRLLESFADSADSMALRLQASALPGTRNHVLLPVNSLKDDEVYAPNYKNGQQVVLIRHPHGGIFEIPQLKVNNKNKEARERMGTSPVDAIGINSTVAQQLSGADFDGDTVLVIPTDGKRIKTSPPLKALENFDPMVYQNKDVKPMPEATKELQMGVVSNLISDMTVKGASMDEIARAVKHSMVVIDAPKHHLDYRLSAKENGITALKRKYQNSGRGGASTIISRASSPLSVVEERVRPDGTVFKKTRKSTPMAETDDARTLVSDNPQKIELIYADHANMLKSMANQARKEAAATPNLKYSPSARVAYKDQVETLDAKLNIAERNAPVERQAQLLGNITVNQKKAANPNLSKDDLKKLKARELAMARTRVGARREPVIITPKEWDAIQAGAISNDKLSRILSNTDLDKVKQYATPRQTASVGPAVLARARAMMKRGYTQAEVASALGISTSAVQEAVK